MPELDYSFVESARRLEVDAVDGGRASAELSVAPTGEVGDEDESSLFGLAVDDIEEREENAGVIEAYLPLAERAYRQRGLTYPFERSGAGYTLQVLPGCDDLAEAAAGLSSCISQGQPAARDFEKRAFRALHALTGGWGVCVGAPRENGEGPERAVGRFRAYLREWERGMAEPQTWPHHGDFGVDGFVIVGRAWGGPVVHYQAKNTNFRLDEYPEELARLPHNEEQWFGRRTYGRRATVTVLALNTVLRLEDKEEIYAARGPGAYHIIDAVDILCAEHTSCSDPCRAAECIVL